METCGEGDEKTYGFDRCSFNEQMASKSSVSRNLLKGLWGSGGGGPREDRGCEMTLADL